MTMERHHAGTILTTRHRRVATVGISLALSAAVVLGSACSRQNAPNVDPGVKSWFENSYRPAINDMAKAAGAAKTVKEGCQAAGDALVTHENQLTKTPDSQLTQLVRQFVDERKTAYAQCVETGTDPSPSATIPQIQRRVNELNAKGRAG